MASIPGFTLIIKIAGFLFKKWLWKNKNIVYINSNVKPLNKEDIRPLIRPSDSRIIDFQTKKNNSFCSYKRHFFRQKITLYPIYRNIKDSINVTYCGFPSQMFAIFDGFIFGNTRNYIFFELDRSNKYYKVSFKKAFSKKDYSIPCDSETLNLIIETSYKIDRTKIANYPTIEFSKPEPNKITNDFLNEVYSFVKNALDSSCNTKVKKVNLYITGKPSVAFIVGTAIESFHPEVNVYNYDNNAFTYYLAVKDGKLKK